MIRIVKRARWSASAITSISCAGAMIFESKGLIDCRGV